MGAAWPWMLAMAHTVPDDARIVRDFDTDLRRLVDMRTPTLMLIGSDSPPRMRRGLRDRRPRAPRRPDRRRSRARGTTRSSSRPRCSPTPSTGS